MDVEKTIEFLLEQQAAYQARFEAWQTRFEAWQVQDQARTEASEAHFAARMDKITEMHLQAEERHDREMGELRAELRRGIRLSIEEQRRERQRRQEMHAELAAVQKLTEQKLQSLIDSLKHPRNGN